MILRNHFLILIIYFIILKKIIFNITNTNTIMNIKKWFLNIKKWFLNIQKWLLNIQKWFLNIQKLFLYIQKWRTYCLISEIQFVIFAKQLMENNFLILKMYYLILENQRFFNIYKGILILENHFLIFFKCFSNVKNSIFFLIFENDYLIFENHFLILNNILFVELPFININK